MTMPRKAPCTRCGRLRLLGSTSRSRPTCWDCRRIEPQRATSAVPKTRRPRAVEPRGTTAVRGYGREHQVQRAMALEAFQPGDPCARCRRPMLAGDPLELDHTPDRSGYLGLSHSWCNRSHRAEGTTRPETRQRSCAICGSPFRARAATQRACSRPCGVEWRRRNAALV